MQYKFNELLDFPSAQKLKIIVNNQEGVEDKLLEEINTILQSPNPCKKEHLLDSRKSKTGKYISYSVKIYFESAQKMEKLYNELPKYDFVQHVL